MTGGAESGVLRIAAAKHEKRGAGESEEDEVRRDDVAEDLLVGS